MREVKCQWQEKVSQEELTHQLEPGEPHPFKIHNGVIIDFVSVFEVIRQGVFQSQIYAVVLDQDAYTLSYKLLTSLRLVRPKAEESPGVPAAIGVEA